MPVPLIQGLIDYLQDTFTLNVWDGEIPRQTPTGLNVAPSTPIPTPPALAPWPPMRVTMTPAGLDRGRAGHGGLTFEDVYGDNGLFTVTVWDTTRASLEDTASAYGWVSRIEQALCNEANWPDIVFNSLSSVTYAIFLMNLMSWTVVNEEEQRLRESQLLYRGDVTFEVGIHGSVPTR